MSAANNGGPAFPVADDRMVHSVAAAAILGITDPAEKDRVYIEARGKAAAGMSLRDYFATKAMHAELSTAGMCEDAASALMGAAKANGQTLEQRIAFNAYSIADAMLTERAK